MMRAAVYLRISSDPTGEQLGVTRQREDCLKLCAGKGWTPVEYLDNDVSATNGKKRPAYENMLADIRDGQIGAVVCWDLDRLHRRPIELEAFMALADEHHLALATVSGDIDLSTAQGRLVARLKGSVAAHETEHKRARQMRAAKQMAEQGRPHWRQAFGYLPTADGPIPDPATAPLVADAYRAVLAGASLSDIARDWNARGVRGPRSGRPWAVTTLSTFLRKPRNAGLRAHNGTIVGPGTWEPLVDEQTWHAAQAVLNAPERAPGRKTVRKHRLTGVLGCGKCGHYLSGNIDGVLVYSCKRCRGVSIRAEHVEPLVYALVAGRLAQPDAVDLLKAEQHDQAEAEALRLEAAALHVKLDGLARDYAEGLLSARQVKVATDALNGHLEAIARRQQDTRRVQVFADLPLGDDAVLEAVTRLSPDRFRAVLDVLATVTVAPVGKGHRTGGVRFDPGRIQVTWK